MFSVPLLPARDPSGRQADLRIVYRRGWGLALAFSKEDEDLSGQHPLFRSTPLGGVYPRYLPYISILERETTTCSHDEASLEICGSFLRPFWSISNEQ